MWSWSQSCTVVITSSVIEESTTFRYLGLSVPLFFWRLWLSETCKESCIFSPLGTHPRHELSSVIFSWTSSLVLLGPPGLGDLTDSCAQFASGRCSSSAVWLLNLVVVVKERLGSTWEVSESFRISGFSSYTLFF